MKDFDSEQLERHAGIDPATLEFKLGGKTLTRLVSFSPYILTDFQTKEEATMEDTVDTIEQMIAPQSHKDFRAALKGGKPRPSMDTLMELLTWLVEQASSRPTSPVSNSSDGSDPTGDSLTDVSPPAVGLTSAV